MRIIKILILEKLASIWWLVAWKIIKTKWAREHSTMIHTRAVTKRLTWCGENIYNASDWHGVNVRINNYPRTIKFLD